MEKTTTILCIDDDEMGLRIRKLMLEAQQYQVLTAISGQEGLALLDSQPVDAVILDYQMPTMNGAQVAHSIRQKFPDLPIVMLSGYPEDVPQDALQLVSAFVTKGGAPEQLFVTINSALSGKQGARITILNVDDNEANRYAITRVLKRAGFDVIEAKTGREALDVAGSCPALIILDINLPDMLGFDVCRRLKSDPLTCDIPIVHISATYPTQAVGNESLHSGASRFLEHPQDPLQIVNVVQEELRKSGRIQN
jgi:CheY-like chemotaxis protein